MVVETQTERTKVVKGCEKREGVERRSVEMGVWRLGRRLALAGVGMWGEA